MKELIFLVKYIMQYKTKMYLGFIFVTLSNISSTFIPRVVGKTIDMLKTGHFTSNQVIESILLILLLTAASGVFMFLTRQTIIVVSRLIEYDLRRDFLNAIEKQSMNFFNYNSTGSLMANTTNDITAAREFLGPAIMYAANTITTFTFVLYFMLTLSPSITLFSFIPIPLIAITTYNIGKKVHIAFKNVQEQFSDLTTQAQESFSGVRVVRAYVREEYESKQFQVKSQDYLYKNLRLARIQAIMMPGMMLLVGISQLIVLFYGGWQVMQKHSTLGDITQFFIYINQLIWPVAAIGWITNLVQRASASAERLNKIFRNQPDILDSTIQKNGKPVPYGEINFKDVSFAYKKDLPLVFDKINLSIPKGTSLGIVGGVGSGKSTLINLIARLYDANDGIITIDGSDIRSIQLRSLRNMIGMVPQEPFLFSMSIMDNIKFGKPDATMEEIEEISKLALLHDEVLMFPDKYNTMLGERGITLSGGQKQRLAIARALIKNPIILILDDALSAVDTDTEDKILTNLKSFMKNRTTIIISHRISAVKSADNIITIESGRIIEQGNHNQLLSFNGNYAEIFQRQQLEEEIEHL